jgi:REP element-mobilizing transposase RayT
MKTKTVQREFAFTNWGGKRRGAGRKPKGRRAGVSHAKRPAHVGRDPVLVTQKMDLRLPLLRNEATHHVVADALAAGTKEDFRVVEYSLQNDHLHLIVEAEDERALSRWLKGLFVRLARALNRLWGRMGNVFPDRYHARSLTTPRAVRIALVYLFGNARKHGSMGRSPLLDAYSSAPSFDGWKRASDSQVSADSSPSAARPRLLERARTWLLSLGWRRHGLIDPRERPATS